jgi:hypothetical protein
MNFLGKQARFKFSFLKILSRPMIAREDIITNEQMKKRLKEKIEMRKNKTKEGFFNKTNPMGGSVRVIITIRIYFVTIIYRNY